jgi:hypothetical protein
MLVAPYAPESDTHQEQVAVHNALPDRLTALLKAVLQQGTPTWPHPHNIIISCPPRVAYQPPRLRSRADLPDRTAACPLFLRARHSSQQIPELGIFQGQTHTQKSRSFQSAAMTSHMFNEWKLRSSFVLRQIVSDNGRARVLRADSPPTRGRRSIGSGGES